MFPTFLFHPVHAPDGQIFTQESAYAEALSDGWVDSPAKCAPHITPEPEPLPEPEPREEIPPRRRRREVIE